MLAVSEIMDPSILFIVIFFYFYLPARTSADQKHACRHKWRRKDGAEGGEVRERKTLGRRGE
jgi:hypothetical protein